MGLRETEGKPEAVSSRRTCWGYTAWTALDICRAPPPPSVGERQLAGALRGWAAAPPAFEFNAELVQGPSKSGRAFPPWTFCPQPWQQGQEQSRPFSSRCCLPSLKSCPTFSMDNGFQKHMVEYLEGGQGAPARSLKKRQLPFDQGRSPKRAHSSAQRLRPSAKGEQPSTQDPGKLLVYVPLLRKLQPCLEAAYPMMSS